MAGGDRPFDFAPIGHSGASAGSGFPFVLVLSIAVLLIDFGMVRSWLLELQDTICAALEEEDGTARFRRDVFEREGGGLSRAHALEDGPVLERAAALREAANCGQ